MNNTFGIIGGDKRQLYLAKSIMDDDYKVYVAGFELSKDTAGLYELPVDKLIELSDNIILPLPATRDGVNIFAPYSEKDIAADDLFVRSLANKNVFGGLMNKLVRLDDNWKYVNWADYYLREELAVSNSIPTAEGAIALGVMEHDGVLCGSNCLVTGFGRIGKILTKMLLGIGARVTVAARKARDFAQIRSLGADYIAYSDIKSTYDIIFNTVPEIVIDKRIISFLDKSAVIIELASLPGGIDRKAAAVADIKVVDGQSLPGKYAPKASGSYIKETIYNILEE